MADTTVVSSLESANTKLKRNNFPFGDLPHDRSDPLWTEIRREYGLSLPEVSALKNASAGTTSNLFMLFHYRELFASLHLP